MSTLTAIVEELQISNELVAIEQDQSSILYDILQELGRINYTLNAMFDEAKKNALLASRTTPQLGKSSGAKKDIVIDDPDLVVDDPAKMSGMLLGALSGLAAGVIAGVSASIATVIAKFMPENVKKLASQLRNSVKSYFGAIANTIKAVPEMIGKQVSKIAKSIKQAFTKNKFIKKLGTVLDEFKNLGKSISPFIESIKSSSKGIFAPLKLVTSLFGTIFEFAQTFFKIFFQIGKGLGRFVPFLGVFLVAWDTITGAIDGFMNDSGNLFSKIIAGMAGAIKGIGKIITIPMDLVKSAISWLAGKMGFDQVETLLDSFSFTELFAKIVDGIEDLIRGLITGAFSLFGIDDILGKAKIKELSEEDLTELSGMEQAKKSNLYDKTWLPRVNSSLNEEGLETATAEQLQAIIEDDDLSDEDMRTVKTQYQKITQTGVYAPAGDTRHPDDPLYEPPPLTAHELELLHRVHPDMSPAEAAAAAVRESNQTPSNPRRRAKTGTIKTAIGRDPATGMPMAQHSNQMDPTSGEIITYNDFAASPISGFGNAAMASQQMATGTTKMNDGNARLAQGNSGGTVAINAPSTSNVSNNTTVNSGAPSAVDKSDRTSSRTGRR